MKIGLQPPGSGRLATPAFITEVAELGDRLGYDSLYITDHVVLPVEVQSRYPYNASGVMASNVNDIYYEPLSLLAYLVGRTQRIRLGTSVLVVPYRNPVLVAKQLACMDALSGGRMQIGVGVGWMEEEFKILGSPPYAERGAVTDEYIRVYRTIWNEEVPAFEGTYVRFPAMGVNPRPAQVSGIPILVGGNTRPGIRRAVRLGDGWHPIKLAPDALIPALQYLRRLARESGRDLTNFAISLRLGLRMSKGPVEPRAGEDYWTVLAGPARELMSRLRTYRDLGVTEVVFDFRTCLDEDEIRETVQLCGDVLVPAFAGD